MTRLCLFAILIACGFLFACTPTSSLEEGRWSGTLTPMNHPEMTTPVVYDVRYVNEALTIDLIGPGGAPVSTQRPRLKRDTLFFAFHEPEEKVRLRCALQRVEEGAFAGRCTDTAGKWARFTMRAPG